MKKLKILQSEFWKVFLNPRYSQSYIKRLRREIEKKEIYDYPQSQKSKIVS